jgi:hypothetical protein
MHRFWRTSLSTILLLIPSMEKAAAEVNFQREVRPILSDKCFACHGPDPSSRMVGMRLDLRETITAKRPNGTPVIPGDPEASLIIQRINAENPARRMPPAYSHRTLTDEQKETLRQWIAEGAKWNEHWSFIRPVRPALPAVKNEGWTRNPIDRFLVARLEAADLAPAPEADRRTLIRRASLDLRGLPPSPEETTAFVDDKSPDAYEKLVDRLLASAQFGEHRAHYWLDAARYGDTNGMHYDNYRGGIWPYRDWVVSAFNRNLPYDRFVIEQLAGDLLPGSTIDQKIATGFNRNNVTTNEGGVIEDEVAAMYSKDRADTTSSVFLGLTVACATCHDHKFDPILQRDHYAFEAFFRNTTQAILDENRPDAPPLVVVPKAEDRNRWSELNQQRELLTNKLAAMRKKAAPAASTAPVPSAPFGELFAYPGKHAYDGKTSEKLPALGITGDQPFSISTWVYLSKIVRHPGAAGGAPKIVPVVATQVSRNAPGGEGPEARASTRGWTFDLDEGVPALKLFGDDGKQLRGTALHNNPIPERSWTHLAATYDGSRKEEGLRLYVNGSEVAMERGGGYADNRNVVVQISGTLKNDAPLVIGDLDGEIRDFRIFNRVITEEDAKIAAGWPGPDALRAYELSRNDRDYRQALAELDRVNAELKQIDHRADVAMVMEERQGSVAKTNILKRGQYDQPGDEVLADVPSALPPMPASYPRNRLGLAQWLVDAENPLTSRVAVNRFWQEVFGTGIVKSTGDFGSQGEAPSHPELLDWLAVEFRESGWDTKKLFRLMLTSAAYRQSAVASESARSKDPDNRLISRGPSFRLDGEVVRDLALSASGLLVTKMGGPPVKPYQPAGVWEATSMLTSNTRNYTQDHGESLYRRSLYTLWKRSAPPASMDIFDGPTRESCVVRRERTNTPLQALAVMNDPQFVEAARALAERAMGSASLAQRVDYMTLRVLARTFDARERAIVERSFKDFLAYYDGHREDAAKLISVGESRADPKLSQPELAALTMVANQVLSLDETLNK